MMNSDNEYSLSLTTPRQRIKRKQVEQENHFHFYIHNIAADGLSEIMASRNK
jgi:hypothetical protein